MGMDFGDDPILSGLYNLLGKVEVLNNTQEAMDKRLEKCEKQTEKNTISLATIKGKQALLYSLPGLIVALIALFVAYMKKG